MKVKDYPNLSKENGSVISTDSNAYQKRLTQIRQRERIENLEKNQNRLGDDLKEIEKKLDLLIGLLQEK